MNTNKSTHRFSDRRLYGQDGDESLASDLGGALDDLWDGLWVGAEVEINEYSVLPPGDYGGDSIDTPETILLMVLDRAIDDCGFEPLGEWLYGLRDDEGLLNYCRGLVAGINARQRFMVADQVVDRHLFRWDGDNWIEVER